MVVESPLKYATGLCSEYLIFTSYTVCVTQMHKEENVRQHNVTESELKFVVPQAEGHLKPVVCTTLAKYYVPYKNQHTVQ